MSNRAAVMDQVTVTVSIDTEEDNWGSFSSTGATVENVERLRDLHERLTRWGARPTYLVNHPPLLTAASVAVLGELAERPEVEIGTHCHPWNTPPVTGVGRENSMMCRFGVEENRAKVAEMTRRIESELGVRPTSFRAGRWGFGPTVSEAIAAEGYRVDASVSPFVDWRDEGGPDYTRVSSLPYRFDPARPFVADPHGSMVELPTTVGFLQGGHRRRASLRWWAKRRPLRGLKIIGTLETLGLINRRWLSPESSSKQHMIQLAEACMHSGEAVLDLTFHSCSLLPGATPWVRDDHELGRFLHRIDALLRFCFEGGCQFAKFAEVGARVSAADGAGVRAG